MDGKWHSCALCQDKTKPFHFSKSLRANINIFWKGVCLLGENNARFQGYLGVRSQFRSKSESGPDTTAIGSGECAGCEGRFIFLIGKLTFSGFGFMRKYYQAVVSQCDMIPWRVFSGKARYL